MKLNKTGGASLLTAVMALLLAFSVSMMPSLTFASGGSGGGGGGGTQVPNFSGNWSGTITTPFGTGLFTMAVSQSSGNLSGSVHFGAPIFDATLKLAAFTPDGIQFSGYVLKSKGGTPITGILSADGSTITGTVHEFNEFGSVYYIYVVTRN